MTGYTWRTIVLKNRNREKKRLVIEAAESGQDLVCDFINTEMPSFSEMITGSLEEMEKTGKQARFSGNRYSLAAGKEKALITMDTDEELLWCEISTEDLRRLLKEWCERTAEF
ncbi:MAG: hypothetical protein IKG46_03830 [Solobacterium sp.]|nr:hypothetical protein [Solobacterium sp.]